MNEEFSSLEKFRSKKFVTFTSKFPYVKRENISHFFHITCLIFFVDDWSSLYIFPFHAQKTKRRRIKPTKFCTLNSIDNEIKKKIAEKLALGPRTRPDHYCAPSFFEPVRVKNVSSICFTLLGLATWKKEPRRLKVKGYISRTIGQKKQGVLLCAAAYVSRSYMSAEKKIRKKNIITTILRLWRMRKIK